MNEVRYTEKEGRGFFIIEENSEIIGEMVVRTKGHDLTVYHTEVDQQWEGHGLAKALLDAMTAYARSRHLKVIPLCSYVQAQFKKNPQQYADIV